MSKRSLGTIAIILIIVIFVLGIVNIRNGNKEFWTASAFDCLSLLIVVGVSFFIVERQTDKRKQKELFITLLEALKFLVEDKTSYDFSDLSQEEILMRMREIRLKLQLIKKYSDKFGVEKDYSFLNEKFEEYQTVIDNHPSDIVLLRKLHKELYRPLNLMGQRIFEMMIALYN